MTKKVTLPSLVALFALRIAAVDAATLDSYYQFEDPAGTTAANSVALAPAGTLVNGPTFTTGPMGLGQALDFDGVNDHLDTTTGGFPNSAATLGSGSISFWVQTTDADPFAFTGSFNNTGGTQAFQLLGNAGSTAAGPTASRLSGYVRPPEGVDYDLGWAVDSPTVNWRDGGWHHILHTWQNEPGGDFDFSVFIDGQEQTTVPSSAFVTPSAIGTFNYGPWDNSVSLGRRNLSGNEFYADISLDDYGVYSGQLTDGEAAAVYNLAVEIDLLYDLGEADLLFNEFNDPTGGVTIGALTWTVFSSGLSGDPGQVIKNGEGDFTLFLTDTAGLNGIFGLESVPEPASIAVWSVIGLALVGYGWRRRRSK
jgi:hypothetical protein